MANSRYQIFGVLHPFSKILMDGSHVRPRGPVLHSFNEGGRLRVVGCRLVAAGIPLAKSAFAQLQCPCCSFVQIAQGRPGNNADTAGSSDPGKQETYSASCFLEVAVGSAERREWATHSAPGRCVYFR